MVVALILMKLLDALATEAALDASVLAEKGTALLGADGAGSGDVLADGAVAGDVVGRGGVVVFGAEG